jgi:rfaE bifunctional protein kinase chain/domain
MVGRPVILVVDLVADRYISGSPKRVSREAPIVILRFEREDCVLGGGANAIANVRALGGEPLPLGVLGTDESGRRIRAELERLGVTTQGILDLEGYLTPTKTRIMGGDAHSVRQQVARYDVESVATIGDAERRHFRACLERWSGRAAVAVMSDYGYGAVLPETMDELRGALAAPRCVLCDSRYRLGDFAGMTGATPNQEEVERLTGGPVADDAGRVASGGELRRRLAAEFLLMTRGSQGMLLFEADRLTRIPVHGTGQVADVTGAGDTVIGALALARAAGASPVEAALLANYAAGIVVHKPGTATASTDELRRAIQSDPDPVDQCRSETL